MVMSEAVIHYRFKSSRDTEKFSFSGLSTSVRLLKKYISEKHKLDQKSSRPDKSQAPSELVLQNENTGEEYTSEDAEIPKNTTIVVLRQLIGGEKHEKPEPVEESSQDSSKTPSKNEPPKSGPDTPSYPYKDFDPNQLGLQDPTFIELRFPARIKEGTDISELEDLTEDEKILAMMYQCLLFYDHTQYQRPVAAQRGPPPLTYTCNRCGQSGHWARQCTASHDFRGIARGQAPRQPVVTPSNATANPAPYASVPVDSHEYEEIPVELRCSLCQGILRDPVTLPCCNVNFCDSCIRDALVGEEDGTCPNCKSSASPDACMPNMYLRGAVEKWERDMQSKKQKKKEEAAKAPQSKPAHPGHPIKESPTHPSSAPTGQRPPQRMPPRVDSMPPRQMPESGETKPSTEGRSISSVLAKSTPAAPPNMMQNQRPPVPAMQQNPGFMNPAGVRQARPQGFPPNPMAAGFYQYQNEFMMRYQNPMNPMAMNPMTMNRMAYNAQAQAIAMGFGSFMPRADLYNQAMRFPNPNAGILPHGQSLRVTRIPNQPKVPVTGPADESERRSPEKPRDDDRSRRDKEDERRRDRSPERKRDRSEDRRDRDRKRDDRRSPERRRSRESDRRSRHESSPDRRKRDERKRERSSERTEKDRDSKRKKEESLSPSKREKEKEKDKEREKEREKDEKTKEKDEPESKRRSERSDRKESSTKEKEKDKEEKLDEKELPALSVSDRPETVKTRRRDSDSRKSKSGATQKSEPEKSSVQEEPEKFPTPSPPTKKEPDLKQPDLKAEEKKPDVKLEERKEQSRKESLEDKTVPLSPETTFSQPSIPKLSSGKISIRLKDKPAEKENPESPKTPKEKEERVPISAPSTSDRSSSRRMIPLDMKKIIVAHVQDKPKHHKDKERDKEREKEKDRHSEKKREKEHKDRSSEAEKKTKKAEEAEKERKMERDVEVKERRPSRSERSPILPPSPSPRASDGEFALPKDSLKRKSEKREASKPESSQEIPKREKRDRSASRERSGKRKAEEAEDKREGRPGTGDVAPNKEMDHVNVKSPAESSDTKEKRRSHKSSRSKKSKDDEKPSKSRKRSRSRTVEKKEEKRRKDEDDGRERKKKDGSEEKSKHRSSKKDKHKSSRDKEKKEEREKERKTKTEDMKEIRYKRMQVGASVVEFAYSVPESSSKSEMTDARDMINDQRSLEKDQNNDRDKERSEDEKGNERSERKSHKSRSSKKEREKDRDNKEKEKPKRDKHSRSDSSERKRDKKKKKHKKERRDEERNGSRSPEEEKRRRHDEEKEDEKKDNSSANVLVVTERDV